jgi:hypothetical protein
MAQSLAGLAIVANCHTYCSAATPEGALPDSNYGLFRATLSQQWELSYIMSLLPKNDYDTQQIDDAFDPG